VSVEGNEVSVTPPTAKKASRNTFAFDHCFGPAATQEDIFSTVGRDTCEKLLKGYSCSILAYGQTGSGKSHTMLGPVPKHTPRYAPTSTRGLIPRMCEYLLGLGKQFEIRYYEIYNEKVKDLLSDQPLRVREHPQLGPFVDCPSRAVGELHDAVNFIEMGNRWRKTASTQANYISSRSHAIFEVRFAECVLYMGDLAGSERTMTASSGAAANSQFERALETSNINKSLLHLGKVIHTLAALKPGQQPPHVPYRDSVLTWLLKDSFGGNSCTYMVSTVTPHEAAYQETLSTLRYSHKATKIINCPVAGSHAASMTANGGFSDTTVVKQMRTEIMALRSQLQSGSDVSTMLKDVTKQFEDKLIKAEEMMAQREQERESLIKKLKLKTDIIERLEDDVTTSRRKQEENERHLKVLEQEWLRKQQESPAQLAGSVPPALQVELLHKRLNDMEEKFEAQLQLIELAASARKSATPIRAMEAGVGESPIITTVPKPTPPLAIPTRILQPIVPPIATPTAQTTATVAQGSPDSELTSDSESASEDASSEESEESEEESVDVRITNMVQRSVARPPTSNGSLGISPRTMTRDMGRPPVAPHLTNNTPNNTIPPHRDISPRQPAQNIIAPPPSAPPTQRAGLGPSPRIPSLSPLRGLLSNNGTPNFRLAGGNQPPSNTPTPTTSISPPGNGAVDDFDYDAEHERMHSIALRNKRLAEQQSVTVRRMLEAQHSSLRAEMMSKAPPTATTGGTAAPAVQRIRIHDAVEVIHPDNRVEYRTTQISPRPDLKRIQQKYHDAMSTL
jgi:hypothetical protein